ncbi:amino acid adenylation domain-containing protein [Streptomyces sp. DSM 41527]|uniref:Amino acid adenylation domain-containing protein n=1 Tax=Streptomyces mooreae TaxID=3075523 RepID=A0ABU2T0F7_9ACTN|nr:amino acid adenylation domain-containing protein [Streptomyces sp. DSM 41527]MDT0454473.1 amino acid adenylation domain-containing protein [Streptomyces sp. DSM 41527]
MTSVEGYRLSPAQLREWERDGDLRLTARVRLGSAVDRHRLSEALATVVGRHEVLRLRLLRYPGVRVPLQGIDEAARVALEDTEPAETEDLFDGPLFRAALVDRPDGGQELILRASAMLTDAAGLRLLLDDLAAAFRGDAFEDGPERLQFLDVSEWLLEQADAADTEATGPADGGTVVERLPLPFSEGKTGAATAVLSATLGEEVTEALHRRATVQGVPVASLVLAAWALALSRHGEGATDDAVFLLGLHDDGRSVPGTESVVGPLAGYAKAAIPLSLPPAPKELLDVVQRQVTRALEAARATGPAQGGELAAGFTALGPDRKAQLAGLPAADVTVDGPEPVSPLHLSAEISPRTTALELRYDASNYGSDAVQRLLDATLTVLTTLPAAFEEERALQLCGDEEAALLARWGTGGELGDGPETLVQAFDAALAAGGAAPAVVAADGTVSFAELERAASAVAAVLLAAGTAVEEPVAVAAERSWRTVAAMIGVLRAGAVYLPLDTAAPAARQTALLRSVSARRVITGQAGTVPPEVAGEFEVLVPDLTAAPATAGPPEVGPRQAAYIIFTSGSTGAPRPVVVEHGSAAHLYRALEQTVYAGTGSRLRVAVNAPLTFDASVKQLVQLAAGHTLCLIPEETRYNGGDLLAYLAEQRADVFDCTPSHLRVVLAAAQDAAATLPAVLLVGGEAVDQPLWDSLAALEGVRAFNVYGPTECTVDTTVAEIAEGAQPSIGRPLPGTDVMVLDQDLRPVPAGRAGELCVAGPQVARGYLGDADATARRFVTTQALPGGERRVYRTGDRVRFRADGTLAYLGRTDDQVKLRGYRVEPGEVQAILGTHPAVGQALVMAGKGEDGTGLTGYATPAPGASGLDLGRVSGINPHETRYLYDEIFLQRTYLRGDMVLREDAVVLDVGANIGMFSLYVHQLCPSASLYAFEPLAPVYGHLRDNVGRFGVPAKTYPHGLGATDGELSFTYYPGYSMMSGVSAYADAASEVEVIKRYLANERQQGLQDRDQLLDRADELLEERFREEELHTRIRRLSDVITEEGLTHVDLLKIDVQRAEWDVLRGIDDHHWSTVQQVVMEVHDAAGTATEGRLDEIVALLEAQGFAVTAEQDGLLEGTDRHSLYAVRPDYAGDPRPVLADARTPAPADGDTLRDWLAERLPSHLVPGAVVVLDAFPLTRNGKVDRAALPEPVERDRAAGEVVLPASRAEEVLAEVWREALAVERVSVADDFFRLGGDSIRAIQLQVAAGRRGLTVRLHDIFRCPTIRELAAAEGTVLMEGAAAR